MKFFAVWFALVTCGFAIEDPDTNYSRRLDAAFTEIEAKYPSAHDPNSDFYKTLDDRIRKVVKDKDPRQINPAWVLFVADELAAEFQKRGVAMEVLDLTQMKEKSAQIKAQVDTWKAEAAEAKVNGYNFTVKDREGKIKAKEPMLASLRGYEAAIALRLEEEKKDEVKRLETDQSCARVAVKYPDINKEGSEFRNLFLKRLDKSEEENVEIFQNSNWPELIADGVNLEIIQKDAALVREKKLEEQRRHNESMETHQARIADQQDAANRQQQVEWAHRLQVEREQEARERATALRQQQILANQDAMHRRQLQAEAEMEAQIEEQEALARRQEHELNDLRNQAFKLQQEQNRQRHEREQEALLNRYRR